MRFLNKEAVKEFDKRYKVKVKELQDRAISEFTSSEDKEMDALAIHLIKKTIEETVYNELIKEY